MRLSFEDIVAIVLKKTGKAIKTVEPVLLCNKEIALLVDENQTKDVYFGTVAVTATAVFQPTFKFNNGNDYDALVIGHHYGSNEIYRKVDNAMFTYADVPYPGVNDADDVSFCGYKFTMVDSQV